MIGSWPRLLALRDSQAKLSRWDIANAKSSILQEMLSEELSEVWNDRLPEWIRWCLHDELPFEQAAHVFANAMFLRYVTIPE
ncbi:hypothetical protein BC629DRAFT_1593445 [Irpex lacteus]|nr:hypothetical protein BC629DRAFT_1593445 [Irpex lacteus]